MFEAMIMVFAKSMPIKTLAAFVHEHDTRLWRGSIDTGIQYGQHFSEQFIIATLDSVGTTSAEINGFDLLNHNKRVLKRLANTV